MKDYVIGVDFGSDSVRAIVVDARNGENIGAGVCEYPRWMAGKYSDASNLIFRQHPQDYLDAFVSSVRGALEDAGPEAANQVRALAIDTTGSTPAPVNEQGVPLALLPEFQDNRDAMFYMWKDHSAIEEAKRINEVLANEGDQDYTRFQGTYSAEWYWAKILHAKRTAPEICAAAASWVEHSDWLPAMLTGQTDPRSMFRNACAAGHKALWHSDFGGLPDPKVLGRIDPYLQQIAQSYGAAPQNAGSVVGRLTPEWAQRFGLSEDTIIGGGSFDAHAGAVGAGIRPRVLVKVIGTSTVDMMIESRSVLRGKDVKDICGQAENSIIPGYVGVESGQAAFGDMLSWFRRSMIWPVHDFLQTQTGLTDEEKAEMEHRYYKALIRRVEQVAAQEEPDGDLVALDWFNGRRYPMINESVKSVFSGLSLSTTPPQIYAAMAMAAVFGSKRILDTLVTRGLQIDSIITVGGIPKKSPYIMQMMADVLNRPIKVSRAEQCCATGAAIYAAVAAGIYPDILEASEHMSEGFERSFEPIAENNKRYENMYRTYLNLARHGENISLECAEIRKNSKNVDKFSKK